MYKRGLNFFYELYEDKNFRNTLLKLALPIIIQNFIACSLNMVDMVIVGKLGDEAIASVGIANQYFFLFNLISIGLVSGCGIFIAQLWGKKDTQNIKRFLGLGMMGVSIISLLFTFMALLFPEMIIKAFNQDPIVVKEGIRFLRIISLSYFFTGISVNFACACRCIEKALPPMIVSAIAIIMNGVLDYIFVFGYKQIPSMGIVGAAWATVIARVIEMILMIMYIYRSKGVLASKFKEMMNIDMNFVKNASKVIMPVILNEACWALGNIFYVIAYSKIGTKALAAVQICTTVQNLFMVINIGIANAAAVMIGNKIGEGEEKEGKLYGMRFSFISVVLGLFLGSILALSAHFILTFFNVSLDVKRSALYTLYIIAAMMLFKMFNTVFAIGVLQGGGDSQYSFKMQMVTMWLIGVPLAFIGAVFLKLPIYLVVAMVYVEDIVKIGISIGRLFSGKWVKNVTQCVE